MIERRRATRTNVSIVAKAIAGNPPRTHDCRVVDISSFGARLEPSNGTALPNIFELTFDSARTLRICHVAWRGADQVGVEFAPKAASARCLSR